MSTFTVLVDDTGLQWVAAELSPTRARSLVKSYAKAGIALSEKGAK
jgi:hypothetical protein